MIDVLSIGQNEESKDDNVIVNDEQVEVTEGSRNSNFRCSYSIQMFQAANCALDARVLYFI